jgi:hypothetical protein
MIRCRALSEDAALGSPSRSAIRALNTFAQRPQRT